MSTQPTGAETDGFFSRWSRRKLAARQGEALAEPLRPLSTALPAPLPAPLSTPVCAPAALPTAEPVARPGGSNAAAAAAPAPTLDDVAALEAGADVARFVAPGVARQVKHAALKKLFADPHFNVMDGLDVYIEDFGRPDPLPAEMLQAMLDAPSFRFLAPPPEPPTAQDPDRRPDAAAADTDTPALALPAAEASPSPEGPDEDPDLRLQPLDAAHADPAGPGAPGPGGDAGRLA